MYTIRIHLVAYILLMSHSLMSCYNPDMVTGQKKLHEKIQQEKQQQEIFLIAPAQKESQQGQLSIFEQPVSLCIHPTTQKEENTRSKEPTSSIDETSSLSQSTQQSPKSLSSSLVIQPGKLKNFQGKKRQIKKQPTFFHPLHPTFKNRQGCQVQFTAPVLEKAHVQNIHGRTFYLRVFKEDPNLQLQDVMAKGKEWRKYHINITFPEQDPHKQGYVRIGDNGLQGGGGDSSKFKNPRIQETRILLACRKCRKALQTETVWIYDGGNCDAGLPHRWVDKCDDCKKYDNG